MDSSLYSFAESLSKTLDDPKHAEDRGRRADGRTAHLVDKSLDLLVAGQAGGAGEGGLGPGLVPKLDVGEELFVVRAEGAVALFSLLAPQADKSVGVLVAGLGRGARNRVVLVRAGVPDGRTDKVVSAPVADEDAPLLPTHVGGCCHSVSKGCHGM